MKILKDTFLNLRKTPQLLLYPTIYAFLNYFVIKDLSPALEGARENIFVFNNLALLISLMIIYYLYRVAYIDMVLNYFKTKKFSLSLYEFINLKVSLKLILVELIVGIIAVIGGFLFVIPGVLWLIFVILYPIVLVANKNLSINEIINKSLTASKGQRWFIFILLSVYLIFNLISMSMPYVLASILDGMVTSFVILSFVSIYINSNKQIKVSKKTTQNSKKETE